MSQPEQPPRFFLDRNLGRKAVPEALRADGWDVITLAERSARPGCPGCARIGRWLGGGPAALMWRTGIAPGWLDPDVMGVAVALG